MTIRLGASVMLVVCAAGCPTPTPAPKPTPPPLPTTASERAGLRASVSSVGRPGPGTIVNVSFVLERAGVPKLEIDASLTSFKATNVWILSPREPAVVRFWDAKGDLIDEAVVWIGLEPSFIDASSKRQEYTLTVTAPPSLASVSVAFGHFSGLESERWVVP